MRTTFHRLSRALYVAAALAVGAVAFLPALEQTVFAGAQVGSRSIEMSNSTPSANNVTYHVQFNSQTTGNTGGIVVQFCGDSPLIGSTSCTTTAAADANVTASPAVSNQSSTAGCNISTFTTVAALSTNNTAVEISNATPVNFTTSNCTISFDITTVTNPTNVATFYARIYTFASQANANAYTVAGGGGTYVDYGGIALSTVSQINITATVQETLTFCVNASSIGNGCTSLTTPVSITIGSGSPAVLHTTGDATQAFTQLSTNASGGATVRMKATNACNNGGLTTAPPDSSGGCLSIPGLGNTAVVFTAGTANWGMCVAPGSGITADNNYKDTGSGSNCPATFNAAADYGMDGASLVSTYGDPIYSTTSGAVSNSNSALTFAAQAGNTTPAGIYQGAEILIATGTF